VQLSLLRRDGYIAAPRGGRDLDENDDAIFIAPLYSTSASLP